MSNFRHLCAGGPEFGHLPHAINFFFECGCPGVEFVIPDPFWPTQLWVPIEGENQASGA